MSEPNGRDREVAAGVSRSEDDELFVAEVIATYRKACVKAERERVLEAIELVMVCSPWQYAEETVEQLRDVLERLEKGL